MATREGKGGHQTAKINFVILHYPGNPPDADHKVGQEPLSQVPRGVHTQSSAQWLTVRSGAGNQRSSFRYLFVCSHASALPLRSAHPDLVTPLDTAYQIQGFKYLRAHHTVTRPTV